MITYSDELYHHGIKGQKWGVRRYQNEDGSLTAAGQKRYAISEQKTKYKNAKRELYYLNKTQPKIAFGIKGAERVRKSKASIEKAELNVIDEKAKLKSLKSKNPEKAEFDTYRKAMQKTGIRNSAFDDSSGGRSTKLYNHLLETKGKEYADRVEKKVMNTTVKQLAAYGTIAAGSLALSAYITKRYG